MRRGTPANKYHDLLTASHKLEDVIQMGTASNNYQALLTTSRQQQQQQKENSFATRVQTQFRSHLARQAFARAVMHGGVLPSGLGTPVGDSHMFDPSTPFNQADFDAFFSP